MKQTALIVLSFVLVILVTLGLCGFIDGLTPVLKNGGLLPGDLSMSQYAVEGLDYDCERGGFSLHFWANAGCVPCSLVVKNLVRYDVYQSVGYRVYQNGDLIYDYADAGAFSRIQVIPLHPIEAASQLQIVFETQEMPYFMQPPSVWASLLGFAPSQPQVMIADSQAVAHVRSLSALINALLVGAFLALMVNSVSLWARAKSQKYLLLIAMTSLIALLMTILVSFFPGIPYHFYTPVFLLLSNATSLLASCTCIYLYHEIWPGAVRKGLVLGAAVLVAGALLIVFQALNLRFYVLLRRLFWAPVLMTFMMAIRRKCPGARLLAYGYTVTEAILFYMYSANEQPPATPDIVRMYFRLTEITCAAFILCCTIVINGRFGARFTQSKALSKTLEETVQERTKALIDAQTRRHNIMLNVFHDLRSPLFVFHNRMEMLHPRTYEEESALAVMKERLSYMERLTEDLFLTFKLESHELLFEFDDTDLHQLLTSLVASNRSVAEQHGISMDYSGKGPCVAWGDSYRLGQAFQNLIDNAIFYTPKGGAIHITLSVTEDWIRATVSDTGAGIAQADIAKVFERYYRSDSHNPNSSGLGLSIVKGIVLAHRGKISVASEKGCGTTFTLYFPLNTTGDTTEA